MKTKVIRFRCTEHEYSTIKALAGPDMSAWILAKLLSPTIDIGQVERKRNAERLSTEIPKAVQATQRVDCVAGTPVHVEKHESGRLIVMPDKEVNLCIHCSNPGVTKGWHNSLLVWFCKDHS